MSNKIILTPEGYSNLKRKIESLEKAYSSLTHDLGLALLNGDVTENADLTLLRQKEWKIFLELLEKQRLLENAEIQEENKKTDYVEVGKIVVYKHLIGEKEVTIELTDEIAADPDKGKVSIISPIGSSLLEKKVGEVLEIKSGKNQYKIQIIEIK